MPSLGYHNDQFFNLKGETLKGGKKIQADNPGFSYPSNIIRTGMTSTNQVLKRGYIRSLVTSSEATATGIRKCQFQFNPTSLQQSVSMASGMLNIMQQDPAQFAQPFAASQNFSFTLMFDRSMEINNDRGIVVTGGDDVDIWAQSGPGQVGVLRDLQALYHTIGQGFSTQQRDYIASVLKDTVKAEAAASTDEDAADQLTKATENIDKEGGYLDINIGNAAFLLPVPVRVVFSSLYVVEGLVTNTSVVFTKFSSKMVPMQCMVTITMEAKYIGFSKQNTFFTEVLRQRELLELQEKQAEIENKNEALAALEKAFSTMTVYATRSSGGVNANEGAWGALTFTELLSTQKTTFTVGNSIPSLTYNTSPAVKSLFESGTSITLKRDATFTVYGPFTSLPRGLTSNTMGTWAKANGHVLCTASYNFTQSSYGKASSANELENFHRATGPSTNSHTLNGTAGPYPFNWVSTSSGYFVIHWEGTVYASLNGEILQGVGDVWKAYGPGLSITAKPVSHTLSLKWPKAQAIPTGTVPSGNASTDPPRPGATGVNGPGRV